MLREHRFWVRAVAVLLVLALSSGGALLAAKKKSGEPTDPEGEPTDPDGDPSGAGSAPVEKDAGAASSWLAWLWTLLPGWSAG